MDYFVSKTSIVRKIWGRSDVIIIIFGGAAAEFALNKAVDWLFFTGKLPADPLNRLFSTVTYAQKIIFSPKQEALAAIDKMNAIHGQVEAAREEKIPDWAYRDVLFLLIDYSIRSYELLERQLKEEEKNEVFNVFLQVGQRMKLKGLPESYNQWLIMRKDHLVKNLEKSEFTDRLLYQYRKHLGRIRYILLKEAQILVVPDEVRKLLHFRKISFLKPAVVVYKVLYKLKLDWYVKAILLPGKYKNEIKSLEAAN